MKEQHLCSYNQLLEQCRLPTACCFFFFLLCYIQGLYGERANCLKLSLKQLLKIELTACSLNYNKNIQLVTICVIMFGCKTLKTKSLYSNPHLVNMEQWFCHTQMTLTPPACSAHVMWSFLSRCSYKGTDYCYMVCLMPNCLQPKPP